MTLRLWGSGLALVLSGFAAGCTSVSSNYEGDITRADSARIVVCHGFDCTYKARLDLGAADSRRLSSIMAGARSAAAERAAVSRAVQYFENRAAGAVGVRDQPKSDISQSREKGQMDCIDESTNTRSLLLHLAHRKLLKHHTVEMNVSRGAFVDGRYPHSTAVLRDKSGARWAVDSWYAPMGGAPDIMPLPEWQSRGVMGQQ